MENRINRLEENAYFLEEQMKALDSLVATQQNQLDVLAKNVEQLQKLVLALRDTIAHNPAGAAADPLPPHHVARFW